MNKPKKGFLVLPILLLLMAAGCSNADEAEQAHTYETKVHTKEIQTNHKDAPSSTEAGKKTVSETETTAKTVPETQQSDADTDTPSQPDTSSQIETTETKTSQDNTKIVSNSEEAVALLKQRFDTTDDSGLIVDPMSGNREIDGYGAYYTLVTKVTSWLENGGFGTADTYLVYEDGTIIDQRARNASQETMDTKLVESADEAI